MRCAASLALLSAAVFLLLPNSAEAGANNGQPGPGSGVTGGHDCQLCPGRTTPPTLAMLAPLALCFWRRWS
jgi:hypothetical protein